MFISCGFRVHELGLLAMNDIGRWIVRSGAYALLATALVLVCSLLTPAEQGMLSKALSVSFIGTPDTVRRGLEQFVAKTSADELIVVSQIYDHQARLRSYELTAKVRDELERTAPIICDGGSG